MEAIEPATVSVHSMLNVVSRVGCGLQPAPTRNVLGSAGDDIVYTLAQLTKDVERFDSMLRNQRHLLHKHATDQRALNDRLIRRQSRRISASAAEIMTRTRNALEELRGFLDVGGPGSF
jgi:hypothetical protein